MTLTKDTQNLFVADIFSTLDVSQSESERQSPREQWRLAFDLLCGKAMPFQNRNGQTKPLLGQFDDRARLDAADGNGDVVARGGRPCHLFESLNSLATVHEKQLAHYDHTNSHCSVESGPWRGRANFDL